MRNPSPSPALPSAVQRSSLDASGVLGLLLVLGGVFLKAMTPVNPLPGWDFDPLVMPFAAAGISGVGPAGSIALDCAILLGSVLLLARGARRGERIGVWPAAALLIGTLAVAWHGLGGLTSGLGVSVGDLRIGVSWLAALTGGTALLHAGRGQKGKTLRSLALGLCIGYVVVMAMKGAEQVLIEHPRTLADFNEHREQFLQARGWEDGSPMARQYERRLSQPDAGGWFSLSNVYASFAAAGLTALAGLLWSVLRTTTHNAWIKAGIGACFLAACAALYFSDSKGGMMAAGAGGVSLVVFGVLQLRVDTAVSGGAGVSPAQYDEPERARRPLHPDHRKNLAGGFALLATFGAIGLVVFRGLLGEKLGELSLLVRWFYMQGATRMFAAEPLVGVGPDGFQQAYLLVRNPLSTEEVTSPHSILFDWSATLGVAGVALGAWWLTKVWRAGKAAVSGDSALRAECDGASSRTPTHRSPPPRGATEGNDQPLWRRHPETTLTLGIVAACLVVAIRLNPELFSLPRVLAEDASGEVDPAVFAPAFLGVIVVVGAVWTAAARIVARAIDASPSSAVAVSASAVVLAVHSQIDVTASWPGSTALVMAWIGLAGSPALTGTRPDVFTAHAARRNRPLSAWLMPGAALLAFVLAAVALVEVRPFERVLAETARAASPIAEVKPMIDELTGSPSSPPPTSARQRELLAQINASFRAQGVSAPGGGAIDSPATAVLTYERTAAATAGGLAEALAELAAEYPREWELRREASRMAITAATSFRRFGLAEPARKMAALAEGLMPDPAAAKGMEPFDVAARHPAGEWIWAATVHQALADVDDAPGSAGAARPGSQPTPDSQQPVTSTTRSHHLDAARAALEQARELDPYGLTAVVRLFELAEARQDDKAARRWARRMLDLDALKRLDREGAGLSSSERSEAEAALGSDAGGGGEP